jgi:glycerol-3-phosphate acyltransferase PlsX
LAGKARIAIDAMGGDFGALPNVEGAIQAVQRFNCEITLVGNSALLTHEIERLGATRLPLRVEHSETVVEMHESPAQACRQKPRSSIMVAAQCVAENRADAVVSAGNSGATMAAALWHMRRLPGVSRPAITTLLPTLKGVVSLTDAGANVDCKPKHLLQFAIMGSQYIKHVFNRPNPKVGLLSIGEEETKGNELTLAAAELFKRYVPNFIGNVEGGDIPKGEVDVVICDGFVGNIVLKFAEGLSEALVSLIKEQVHAHPITKLAGLFLRPSFREVKKKTDYAEYGGAPLLGVNGVCIICHGKSNSKAIYNAVRQAVESIQTQTNQKIREELHRLQIASESPEPPRKMPLIA